MFGTLSERFHFSPLHGIFVVMSRSIIQSGDAVLRATAKEIPVAEIGGAHMRALIADMKKLLAKEKYGVALAAPQVGESIRLFIVAGRAVEKRKKASEKRGGEEEAGAENSMPKEDQVYINPELVKLSRGRRKKHEGCLSVRGKWGEVMRAEKASIRAYDENGKKFTRGASGLLAHIFQHEMDHLDGVLYIDKAKELYDESTEDDRQE